MFVYTALALIIILGTYQLVMAKPGKGKGNTPQPNRNMPISYVQELKLTDDQVTKITGIIQNNNTACAVLEDKIQLNRDKLQVLQWSKNFSKENVDAIAKEMKDTMTQIRLNNEKLIVDIKAQLTLEQVQVFNRIQMRRMKGRRQSI